MKIRISLSQHRDTWDSIVARSKQSTPFHLWKWMKTIEKSFGWKGIGLIASYDGTPVGLFPLCLVPIKPLKIFSFARSLPPNCFGGPIFVDGIQKDVLRKIAFRLVERSNLLDSRILGYSVSLSPLNYREPLPQEDWETLGYDITRSGPEYVLGISKPDEMIWSNYNKRCRWSIRKAMKQDVRITRVESKFDVKDCYQLYAHSMTHAGERPRYPFSTFYYLFDLLTSEVANFYLAEWNSLRIATLVTLSYNKISVYWIGGMLRERKYERLCPMHLLLHHAIEKASKDGNKLFTFGAAPTEGLRRFKESWGTLPLNLYSAKKENFLVSAGSRIIGAVRIPRRF